LTLFLLKQEKFNVGVVPADRPGCLGGSLLCQLGLTPRYLGRFDCPERINVVFIFLWVLPLPTSHWALLSVTRLGFNGRYFLSSAIIFRNNRPMITHRNLRILDFYVITLTSTISSHTYQKMLVLTRIMLGKSLIYVVGRYFGRFLVQIFSPNWAIFFWNVWSHWRYFLSNS
jgi:hypothetical protein